MKLTRGLVLGSALGMAAMAMLNNQSKTNMTNKSSLANTIGSMSLGQNTTSGCGTGAATSTNYTSTANTMNKTQGSKDLVTSPSEVIITDILK